MARLCRDSFFVTIVRAGRITHLKEFNIDGELEVTEIAREIQSYLNTKEDSVWKNYKSFQLEGNNDSRLLTLRKVVSDLSKVSKSPSELRGKYLLDDGYQESYIRIT